MKHIFTLLMITASLAAAAQNPLNGKIYTTPNGAACKERTDGGCMLYYFCELSFGSDSVTVRDYVKAECTPKTLEPGYESTLQWRKTYKYSIRNSVITIEGFDKYGTYLLKEKMLIASNEKNGKFSQLIFEEEEKK